ncbi:MAG: type I phosphomannose isomerase catalytic subunit [Bdellovibrionota bacterium]
MESLPPLLVQKPWAGKFLAKFYGLQSSDIGEAWLLSTIREGSDKLNFVVKIIDAAEPLSVQVHPNDEWAAKLENSKGKTECWLILDSKPGAGVYLGLREGVDPSEYEAELKLNHSVEKFLNFIETKRGDFFVVPAGTVHAIGGGVTLLEVQQASGITYRLWDWGRLGRELHLDKGLKVLDHKAAFEVRRGVLGSHPQTLLKHADFTCCYNESYGRGWFIDLETLEVYHAVKPRSKEYIFVH